MNIKEWAKINGLTPKEFTREILGYAATVGTMEIDKDGDDIDTLVYKVEDDVGKIEVIIRRVS